MKGIVGTCYFFLLCLFLTAPQAIAQQLKDHQKFAIVLGGADDMTTNSTIFDRGFKVLMRKLNAAHYNVGVAFDGGHAHTEHEVSGLFNPSPVFKLPTTFTTAHELKLQSKIESKWKRGDQVVVVINEHGFSRSPGFVHLVETDSGGFDTGRLEQLAHAASKKGVSLAILDLSCYSGLSLALAKHNPNLCVITETTADNVGTSALSEKLFANFHSGYSLESSFLDTIATGPMFGYPEISTPEGKFAQSTLHSLLSKIAQAQVDLTLGDGVGTHDLQVQQGPTTCETQPLAAIRTLLSIVPIVDKGQGPLAITDMARLREASASYLQLRHRLQIENKELDQNHITIEGHKFSWREIENARQVQFLTEGNLNLYRSILKKKHLDPGDRQIFSHSAAEAQATLKIIPKLEVEKALLSKTNNDFAQDVHDWYGKPDKYGNTAVDLKLTAASRPLVRYERKLYLHLYHQAGKNMKGSNPCRDFKF